MKIGDILKTKRLEKNLTQKELAESSGITQSMISKLEQGVSENISIEALRKLAKSLRCPVIDLLPESDKKR